MNKLIMLVGLPASGKSTNAKHLLKEGSNNILLSSDEIRADMFGDSVEFSKEQNQQVFEKLHKDMKKHLLDGKTVIYDATNINSKRRRALLNDLSSSKFKHIIKECHYMNTRLNACISYNNVRHNNVPNEVIHRMYKTMNVPMYHEGWDLIKIINRDYNRVNFDLFDSIDEFNSSQLINILSHYLTDFVAILDLAQDTPHHTLSVSRHTYYVYDYINKNYMGKDKDVMLIASLFHDLGKRYCKEFKEGSRYANFIGHQNVSSQLTISTLKDLNFDDNFVLDVAELVQLHMSIPYDSEKGTKKLFNLLGEELFQKLSFLRQADILAK